MNRLLLLLAVFFWVARLSAHPPTPSGNYGCEITVQCTPNPNILTVTAKVYRNCGLDQLCENCPANLSTACGIVINVSGEEGAYKGVSYGFPTLTVVPQLSGLDAVGTFLGCPNSKSNCSNCGTVSPGQFSPGIEVYVFSGNISLAGMPADLCKLRISWNTAFRSADINTISNPGTTGYHYYTIFNRCITPCNNLPVSTTHPKFIIASGREADINMGMNDAEGDSISYAFGTAYGSASTPVNYLFPLTGSVPFPFIGYPDTTYFPPDGLRFDPKTGNFRFRPSGTWRAPVVIEATQWIKDTSGVMKYGGMVRREFVLTTSSYTNAGILQFDRYDTLGKHLGTVVNKQQIPITFCGGGSYCEWVVTHNNRQYDTSYGLASGTMPNLSNTYTAGNPRKREDSVRVCFNIPTSDSLAQSYYLDFTGSSGECPLPATATFHYKIRIDNQGPDLKIIKNKIGTRRYQLTILDNKNFHLPTNLASWKIETAPGSNSYQTFPASTFQNYQFTSSGIFRIKYRPGISCGPLEFSDTILVPKMKIFSAGVTANSCYNSSSGKIEVGTTDAVGPVTFRINPGGSQASPVFTGLSTGVYRVIATDSINQQDSLLLEVLAPTALNLQATLLSAVKCRNDSNASIQLNAFGGMPPYRFYMDGLPGNPNRFNNIKPGTHTIRVVDSNNCEQLNPYVVTNPDTLIYNFVYSPESCLGSKNASAEIQIAGGKAPYAVQWQTTPVTNGKKISNQASGVVSGYFTDSLGCRINFLANLPYRTPYELEQFCGVSVDTVTGYANLVWNKTPGKGIAQYRVQRASLPGGPFFNIKLQSYAGPNTFTDLAIITPTNNFYYRLLVIDSCGVTATTGGDLHKPVAGSSTTSSNHVNLSWSAYQGRLDALEQKILRKHSGSAFSVIATLNNQQTFFTDSNPGPGINKYIVEMVFPQTCLGNGIPTRIFSNVISTTPLGIQETSRDWKQLVTVYPNPGNGKFYVQVNSNEIQLNSWELFSMDGRLMEKGKLLLNEWVQEISLDFPEGVYALVLQTQAGVKVPVVLHIQHH